MLKNKITFFILIFHIVQCNAQSLFNKRIDGPNWTYPGSSIIRLDDGCLMVGSPSAVVKTDSTGEFIWAKDYGTGHRNLVKGIDGYIYVAGGHDAAGVNNDGMALSKIDTAGNLFWTKTYNFIRGSGAYMIPSNDSDLIVVGATFYVDSIGLADSAKIIVMKADYNGSPQWIKSYRFPNTLYLGLYGLLVTAPGKYLVHGYNSYVDSSKGFTLEIDNNGNVINGLTLSAGKSDLIRRIFIDNHLKIIEITNVYDLSPSTLLTILLSLDISQNIKWAKEYDETCHNGDFLGMIVGKHNHNYLINDGIQVAEIDSTGQIVFRYGIQNNPSSIAYKYVSYLNDNNVIYYTGGEDVTYDYLLVGKSDSTGYSGCSYVNSQLPCAVNNININIQSVAVQSDTFSVSMDTSTFLYIRPPATAYINCPYTGIEDLAMNKSLFNIYPNPAAGILHIDKLIQDNYPVDLSIHNLMGQCVQQQILSFSNNTIELPNNLNSGLYMIMLNYKNKSFHSKLILIPPNP